MRVRRWPPCMTQGFYRALADNRGVVPCPLSRATGKGPVFARPRLNLQTKPPRGQLRGHPVHGLRQPFIDDMQIFRPAVQPVQRGRAI
jgi:hypothetical protein